MARLPYPNYTVKDPKITYTLNIVKLLSYSPATVDHWVSTGNAHFRSLALTPKHRELAILFSAARFGSVYEWTHHIAVSAKVGVTDMQRDVLKKAVQQDRAGRREAGVGGRGGLTSQMAQQDLDTLFTEKEGALLLFLERVADGVEVDDKFWMWTRSLLSEREIVELISLQGFYYTLSRLGTVLKVDIDVLPAAKSKL